MNIRETDYNKLSEQYIITGSNVVLENIFKEYTIDEILKYEDTKEIVYNAIKTNTSYINRIDIEKRNFCLLELRDEFNVNVGIFDIVKSLIMDFDLKGNPECEPILIEIVDIAITHMTSQGFEVSALTITESDISQLIGILLEPIITYDMNSTLSVLSTYITQKNYIYIMKELHILDRRLSNTLFEDIFIILAYFIDLVSSIEIKEPDYDDENYNPLDDNGLSKDDMLEECYKNIPITVYSFDKLDAVKFISTIRKVVTLYDNPTMRKIAFSIIEPYINDIQHNLETVIEREPEPMDVIYDIRDISELEYRLPRLLYLTSGKFMISNYLYNPIVKLEYKTLKDLQIIEQQYKLYIEDSDGYQIKLNIADDLFEKLIPYDLDMTNHMDDIISFTKLDI